MQSICYFIVVDRDKLICYGSNEEVLLPYIKIDKTFENKKEAKLYISKYSKFTIERNSFNLIYTNNTKDTQIYSCLIDANVKMNKDIDARYEIFSKTIFTI